MNNRKVIIDKSGNRTLESDDDCRLNFNFRNSVFISKTLLVCSNELSRLAKLRKNAAINLVNVSKMTKAEAKRVSKWLEAASFESKRSKARRADKSKVPVELEIPRETCSIRSCYAFEYRDGFCEHHYENRK